MTRSWEYSSGSDMTCGRAPVCAASDGSINIPWAVIDGSLVADWSSGELREFGRCNEGGSKGRVKGGGGGRGACPPRLVGIGNDNDVRDPEPVDISLGK